MINQIAVKSELLNGGAQSRLQIIDVVPDLLKCDIVATPTGTGLDEKVTGDKNQAADGKDKTGGYDNNNDDVRSNET